MTVEKQPDRRSGSVDATANDWFQEFLKHVELSLAETAQGLGDRDAPFDYGLAVLRSVKLALLDSGLDEKQVQELSRQLDFAESDLGCHETWTPELNARRFQLIDRDIQGILTPSEQFELSRLTRMMRQGIDSEANLPMGGARKLHQYLLEHKSKSLDSER